MVPTNGRLYWEVIASYKYSSLFGLVISDEGKKFYNIDTRFVNLLGWQLRKKLLIGLQGPYSQHITENLRTSWLDAFISYEENVGLWMSPREPYSQHFFSLSLMNRLNELECNITLSLKSLSGRNTLAYWVHLKVTKKVKCCENGSWGDIHNTTFYSVYGCFLSIEKLFYRLLAAEIFLPCLATSNLRRLAFPRLTGRPSSSWSLRTLTTKTTTNLLTWEKST